MMRLNRNPKQHSLRARYISLALLLGFIMIAGASISYRITLIDTNVADELRLRVTQQSEHLREVDELIHASYRSLDLFLIDPQQIAQRNVVDIYLKETIEHIEKMQAIDTSKEYGLEQQLSQLARMINQFLFEARELFDVRTDPQRQFPSMDITNRMIQPSRDIIVVALNEAIYEAKSSVNELGVENYINFVELQNSWNRMSLLFRLYMINRSGGFETAGTSQQEENINELYASTLQNLAHLKERDEVGQIGFEGSIAIEVLEENLPVWIDGFHAIQKIDGTSGWRQDSHIMQQKILPLTEEIAKQVHSIATTINHYNEQVVATHNQIERTQNLLMGSMIIIIVFYIVIMLISLDKMVFKPIAAVARALKADAFGDSLESLIHTRTRETQDLIDAFHEMNLQVRNRQMALEYQAMHDALTGLPNRAMLLERIEYQLMNAKRSELPLSLFILDLNRFKEVNDTLGHHIGDQLLIDVGQRFQECLREIDTIARLGGDEFAILLPNTTTEQSETVAKKLVEVVNEPFFVDGNQLYIGVSIGIATYPKDGEDTNTLMQHADVAMYNAKLNHIGFTHYNIEDDAHSIGRLSLVQDLRNAIRQNRLELYFQPKIDIFQNITVGVEALLRWNHPELGYIPPDQLVDISEGVGLIDGLTSWVMDRAIKECALLHQAGYKLTMSINLSVKNLLNKELINEIKALLDKYQLSSRFLTFEITESSMMANPENAIKLLNELNGIGVHISVDDFGTGFSSLAYLKQLPVNELKIDKSFVIEMERNDSDAVIVHSTIELGHNLGLNVVAEGVENQQTRDTLKHYGCDLAQGYFISHPLPSGELMTWIKENS